VSTIAERATSTPYTWKTDAITTEVVRHALETIADEMGTALRRTALSVVIKDMSDYTTAVLDKKGNLLAAALTIPALLASMGPALKVCLEKWGDDISPGDVFITNHPYFGSAHSNDIQIFVPAFSADQELLGFTGTIAHHADWGGSVPGTVQTAALSVFEEGVLFPALKLESRGIPNTAIMDIIATNTRFPSQNFGDLRAQLTSARSGARRLEDLFGQYGVERLSNAFDDLLGYTELRTRRAIAQLPDGVHTAEGWLDDNGVKRGTPVRLAVTVTISGDEMSFDFTGTDAQMHSGMNVPWASTLSVVQYAVHCIIPEDIPFNEGANMPIRVVAPLGSLVNPRSPAAVGARHITCERLASVVTTALVPVAPDKTSAEWCIGWPCFFAESTSPKTGEGVAVLLNVPGGAGAKDSGDGADALDPHVSNCDMVSAEAVESGYMLRVERIELIRDSGGAGKYRGGLGIRADYRNIAEGDVYVRTELEQNNPEFYPQGLEGGFPGTGCDSALIRADGAEEAIPPKQTSMLRPGDILSLRSGGGAGWGVPEARSDESVARDIETGRISADAALVTYGTRT
jgi:N-methylhydantoinase B